MALDKDDSELLESALNEQARSGNLILRRRIWINGIAYDPATYILQHVGPAPAPSPTTQSG